MQCWPGPPRGDVAVECGAAKALAVLEHAVVACLEALALSCTLGPGTTYNTWQQERDWRAVPQWGPELPIPHHSDLGYEAPIGALGIIGTGTGARRAWGGVKASG